jgi:hypothetical protein
MITDDSIAAAKIAQLFGSELLNVQTNAITDSGTRPNIVKLDPKQFLTNNTQTPVVRNAEHERQMILQLQKEAESNWPLPEPQQVPPQIPTPQQTESNSLAVPSANHGNVWEKINLNLQRIADSLEKVDISIKKKRIKRSSK